MKKLILVVACNAILSVGAMAQGLYVGGSFGYGLRAGGTVIGKDYSADGSYKVVKGSYGAGIAPALSVGYMFSKTIGAELGLGYLFGKKMTIKDGSGLNTVTMDYKAKANTFYLNPSFVIRGGGEGKLVPYAKVGVFLGMGNKISQKTNTTQVNGSGVIQNTNQDTYDLKGRMSTGLTSSVGVDYLLSDNLAIFGEVYGRLASWAPKSYTDSNTDTNYIGGVAQPSTSTSTDGNLVDKIAAGYSGNDQLTKVLPLSAVGFNIGVKYFFK